MFICFTYDDDILIPCDSVPPHKYILALKQFAALCTQDAMTHNFNVMTVIYIGPVHVKRD